MTSLRELARGVPWLAPSLRQASHWLGLSSMQTFSITTYRGSHPWSVAPIRGRRAQVLTRRHVTDVPAAFVADPFLHRTDEGWFMFFEVLRADTWRGEIAVASSPDGLRWTYRGIVLREPFHLSYPHVFAWDGEVYMIPETFEANAVRLYRAVSFPFGWELHSELLAGYPFADASPFLHDGSWWMFAETSPKVDLPEGAAAQDTLRLYGAAELFGPWTEHPASPIVESDARLARPAGRVVKADERLIRFAQDGASVYGLQVRAIEVEELTPTTYRERLVTEDPILGPGDSRWNRGGMHHIDAHQVDGEWFAAVDGWSRQPRPRLGRVHAAQADQR